MDKVALKHRTDNPQLNITLENFRYKINEIVGDLNVTPATVAVPWINVKNFGAVGNDVADDSAAIQSAIDSVTVAATQAEAGGGGVIFFPPGVYLCNTGLVNNARKVSFIGSGIDNTTLKKGANIDLLKVDSFVLNQTISDMTFDGNSKTSTSLYLNTPNYVTLRNLQLKNNSGTGATNAALYLNSATVTRIENMIIGANGKIAYFYAVNAFYINGLNIGATNSGADDVEFDSCNQVIINGISIDDDGGATFDTCAAVSIDGVYIENNFNVAGITVTSTGGSPTRGMTIKDIHCRKTGTNTSSAACIIINANHLDSGITIDGYHFIGGTGTHTQGHIEIDESYGISLRNITARGGSATMETDKLIHVTQPSPNDRGYMVIENVMVETGGGDSPTIEGMFVYTKIKNTNVPITLETGSHDVIIENSTAAITVNTDAAALNIKLINCTGTITDSSNKAEIQNNSNVYPIKTLANDATPSVTNGRYFLTGGTTTITDFDDGKTGQVITIISEHAITITDGTNIFLNGSADYAMGASDTLTLVQKADTYWYELARSNN